GENRGVGRRSAGWPNAIERGADDVGRIGPCGDDVRLVVEREDEELVRRIEELEEETVDGAARILNALAVHAVARVEKDAQSDRHARARQLRNSLALAVLEDVERVPVESRGEPTFRISDGRGDADDLHARLEQT